MILLMAFALIITIFLHELGHLFMAKLCGCKVEVFSIGFWKPILWWKKIKGTIYQISPWLFGGYCQLKDELSASNDKDSFSNLPYRKKVLISVAGCAINIILGAIFIPLGLFRANYNLYFFGFFNLTLGIMNMIPFPTLDGSYLYLVWLEKFYGKKKGYALMNKLCKIGFISIMVLNVLSVPYIVWLWKTGAFK